MQLPKVLFVSCVVIFAASGFTFAQEQAKIVVSLNPLNAEQLAVYRAVLAEWMDKDMSSINLADRTVPLDSNDPIYENDRSCAKGLVLEPASPTLVHQFQQSDLSQLSTRTIRLVDTKRGEKDVKENDPETSIKKGNSIEDAVRNGFSHGLFTLSEIQFDKQHKYAIVSYGFVCGGLCGNGGTVVLKKTDSGWHESKRCSDWISRLTPESFKSAFWATV